MVEEKRREGLHTGYTPDRTIEHTIVHYPKDSLTDKLILEDFESWKIKSDLLKNLADHAGLISQGSNNLKRKMGESALKSYLYLGAKGEARGLAHVHRHDDFIYKLDSGVLRKLYGSFKPFLSEDFRKLVTNTGIYLCFKNAFDISSGKRIDIDGKLFTDDDSSLTKKDYVDNLKPFDLKSFNYFTKQNPFLEEELKREFVSRINRWGKERKRATNWEIQRVESDCYPYYSSFKPGYSQQNTILSDLVDEIPSGEKVCFIERVNVKDRIPNPFSGRQKEKLMTYDNYKLFKEISIKES